MTEDFLFLIRKVGLPASYFELRECKTIIQFILSTSIPDHFWVVKNRGISSCVISGLIAHYIVQDLPKLHRCTELLSMNEELKQARKAFEVDEEKLASLE